MANSLFLTLREDASLMPQGADQLVLQRGTWQATFNSLPTGTRAALLHLVDGATEDELADTVLQADGAEALARFYYCLRRLSEWGSLCRSARLNEKLIATLVPVSLYFEDSAEDIERERGYVLSRFAYTRVCEGRTILESPLAHARVNLQDPRACALLHALARPQRLAELSAEVFNLPAETIEQFITLLLRARMLSAASDTGATSEDEELALRTWEFHDLLFHARNRKGRHDYPTGGTYRFAGVLPPPPALKPPTSKVTVDLYRPDLDKIKREDQPYALVQETRRSIREYGARPLSVRQLGEFLYRVGRVTECVTDAVETPRGTIEVEFAYRPHPGGGALYELELYPVVNACEGLEPGLYHYLPLNHRLEKLTERTEEVEALLSVANQSTGIPLERLQLLIVIAARFQRFSWKYSSIAYAAILKNVGVLYQTMYLAATAMGLAPCGIGGGDSDLFARAAGTDYYEETSVGEFLLGSKPVG